MEIKREKVRMQNNGFVMSKVLGLVYTYRQCHRFLYHLKMGLMQSYGAVYTYLQEIKGASHKIGDVEGNV